MSADRQTDTHTDAHIQQLMSYSWCPQQGTFQYNNNNVSSGRIPKLESCFNRHFDCMASDVRLQVALSFTVISVRLSLISASSPSIQAELRRIAHNYALSNNGTTRYSLPVILWKQSCAVCTSRFVAYD